MITEKEVRILSCCWRRQFHVGETCILSTWELVGFVGIMTDSAYNLDSSLKKSLQSARVWIM